MSNFARSKTYFSVSDDDPLKSVQQYDATQQKHHDSSLEKQNFLIGSDDLLKMRYRNQNNTSRDILNDQNIRQQEEEDIFSFSGRQKSQQSSRDGIEQRKKKLPRNTNRDLTKFDTLLLKHYDQKNQLELERAMKREKEDLNQKFSQISLNVQANPFQCKRNQNQSLNSNAYSVPMQNPRQPLKQINDHARIFRDSGQNIPFNSMNHPFAQKQFHHFTNQPFNPMTHVPPQHNSNMQMKFDQDKQNNYQPQYLAPSYQQQQQPYAPCYLIQVPQQQNIPIFSHALYPYPLTLNQPMIYPQQTMPPPPPPGFNIPQQQNLQQQQQYFVIGAPPPQVHFNSQIPIHTQHPLQQPNNQNFYQENEGVPTDQQLPQFINPNQAQTQPYCKYDNTPTDDFSQSSFTPTTFSRDYIKKKLDFNSPLSIMSFRKKATPEHRIKRNNAHSQLKRRQEGQMINKNQKYNSLSATVTPQKSKKKNSRTLQFALSDSKYDKKKWFGERVKNIFDRIEELQQSKFKQMNKECLSAEKAMKCIDEQLKLQQ